MLGCCPELGDLEEAVITDAKVGHVPRAPWSRGQRDVPTGSSPGGWDGGPGRKGPVLPAHRDTSDGKTRPSGTPGPQAPPKAYLVTAPELGLRLCLGGKKRPFQEKCAVFCGKTTVMGAG